MLKLEPDVSRQPPLVAALAAVPNVAQPPVPVGEATSAETALASLRGRPDVDTLRAVKASQSMLSSLQALGAWTHHIEAALPVRADDGGAARNSLSSQLDALVANVSSGLQAAMGQSTSQLPAWAQRLNDALANMQNALSDLDASDFPGSASSALPDSKALPPGGATGGNGADTSGGSDYLSAALQSVLHVRSVIDASANSIYPGFLAAGNAGGTESPASQLIAGIDIASGDLDFNIEQTLLQAGSGILRDSATISTLVALLLQP